MACSLPGRRVPASFASAFIVLGMTACQCGVTIKPAFGHLQVDPASIAFGSTAIGTVQDVVVQVKNVGFSKITVTNVLLQTSNDDLALSDVLTANCDGSPRSSETSKVIMGSTCASFHVHYAPHAQTAMSDTVVITSNDPANPTITIPLSGVGVGGTIRVCLIDPMNGNIETTTCYPSMLTPPPAMMMPPTLDFGPHAVGTSSVRKVRVFNEGMFALALNDAHIESSVADFSLIGGRSLSPVVPPGQSVDLQVQFKPETDNTETGNLVIPSNDVVNPTVTVPIAGQSLGPKLCIMPNPVDFGTVAKGSTRTLQVNLSNCGQADYNITQLELLNNDPSSTVFTTPAAGGTNAIPTLPLSFPTGATLTINVTYSPTYVETPPAAGDSGYFSIVTDYQRATVPVTGRGGFPGCNANGMNLAPTATIQVDRNGSVVDPTVTPFDPLTNITLDGSGSIAPSPEHITGYSWRIVSQPIGSVSSIVGAPSSKVTLFVEIVGDYVVELVVSTGDQCQSDPVDVTLHVKSRAAIHVQLTWPQSYGDVDLHYLGPGGSFYETSPYEGDLDWEQSLATAYGPVPPTPTGATPPDWGGPGNYPNGGDTIAPDNSPVDDASLDCDQRQGYGPENVTHNKPFDGTYKVIVHYYCSDDSGFGSNLGAITAVVNIYVNGTLAWHGSMPNMPQTWAWDAADIVVTGGGTNITVTPLTTPVYATNYGCVGF
jgi:hypothetical protein